MKNDENRVAISKDNMSFREHIEYYYPHWKILEYDTDKEMAEAVNSGEADFFITGVTLASKYSRDPSFLQCATFILGESSLLQLITEIRIY